MNKRSFKDKGLNAKSEMVIKGSIMVRPGVLNAVKPNKSGVVMFNYTTVVKIR